MKAVLNAVYWEILRKNWLVFAALALLLGIGAILAWFSVRAEPGADWVSSAQRLALMAFLVSLLIVYAPFTLMESSGGWRMNSMVTRWFALPIRTHLMVLLPLLTGFAFIALFIGLWMPVLKSMEPTLDGLYFVGVMVLGLVALNALAWTVPRKPLQFWVGAAALFPVMLFLALGPQDRPEDAALRRSLLVWFALAGLLFAAFACLAASRNRCGTWRGELPLDWLLYVLRGGRAKAASREFTSASAAMFRVEALPSLRLLGVSWLVLVGILFVYVSLLFRGARGGGSYAFSWKLFPLLGAGALPVFGILWMAIWGVFTAGEPALLFRSRISPFRAALPVTCGQLAAQRIGVLFVGWCLVWLPLLALSFFPDADMMGTSRQELQVGMARFMSIGAFTLIGALPVLLLGRFEGFPNFLLATVCAWAATWGLNFTLKVTPGEEPGALWYLLWASLALKLATAGWAVTTALRQGHITWRFAAALTAGWLAIVLCLVVVLPTWKHSGAYAGLTMVLFVPLARPALCPLALATNRHRG